MCGIAGLVTPNQAPFAGPEAEAIVSAMIATVAHRGPDDWGVWRDAESRCVLGHRRLSVIDTSQAGRQPFSSGDGRWQITFNGQIYNYLEISPQLTRAGITLRGRTDTEVLIETLAFHGVDGIRLLDGMFAFAAFDTRTGRTILARDPFGEKPLYYMPLAHRGLAFASELRALERVPGFDGTVSLDAAAEVISFQYIGAPRTIYTNVYKLPPGHWMTVDADGSSKVQRYFTFEPGTCRTEATSRGQLIDELEELLLRSIRRRLISDVPLGALLSGGVDSSTVCALVRRKLGRPLKTFSLGFRGATESEHEVAQEYARHLGTDHHTVMMDPEGAEFLREIGGILDEPSGDNSCQPYYALSRFARQTVTVALSGDGGDEMFGGYGRYLETLEERDAQQRQGTLPSWRAGSTYYSHRILIATESHLQELFGFVPDGFAAHLNALRAEVSASQANLLAAMRKQDVNHYMPGAVLAKVDRMSMQHSLEVRTPFLNLEVARFAESLPDEMLVRGGKGKVLLRELAYRYLPRELVDMPKQGFGLPMSGWARTSLIGVATELVEAPDGRLAAALGRERVEAFMRRLRSPTGFHAYQIWSMAMLESWLRHHPAELPRHQESGRRGISTSFFAGHSGGAVHRNGRSILNRALRFPRAAKKRAFNVYHRFGRLAGNARANLETAESVPAGATAAVESACAITAEAAQRELTTYFLSSNGRGFELNPGDSIVLCTCGLPPGGAERQWIYLAQGLRGLGYRVTFVTLNPLRGNDAHYLPLLMQSGIPSVDGAKLDTPEITRHLPPIPHLDAILRATGIHPFETLLGLTAAFRQLEPKVVYAQLDDPNVMSGVAATLCGVPRIVVSFRNFNPTHFDWINRDWYLPCYRLMARSGAVRFTGNSRRGNDDYADWIGIPRERVTLVPNVVDPECFPAPEASEIDTQRAGLGIGADDPVLLGVFKFRPEKDPDAFLDVARRVANAIPTVKVLLAGVGPMRDYLEQRAAYLDLGGNFRFLGRRDDLNVFMTLADVLLLTSLKEGMPNVVMEAQLLGTPVVATRIPGTVDVVHDSITAILCAPADVEELAQACIGLLTDKARATAMGAAGRRHILEKFPKSALLEGYVRALD